MATRHTNLLALSIFILLSACSRASFLYKPNKPLWAGHDARAPLFPATAAVLPLIDLTRPAAGEPDLVRAPAGSWPQLSDEDLSRALAQELAADGMVASASVLDDPGRQSDSGAIAAGARILVSGDVAQASVDPGASDGGTLSLALDIRVQALQAGEGAFNWNILNSSYSAQVPLAQYGGGAAAENAALNKIFAQALQDAAQVLQRPSVLPRLGWTQP